MNSQAVTVVEQAPVIDRIIAAAIENNFDLDQVRELYALKRQYEADEARKSFTVAMTEFKAEPLVIEKTKLVSMKLKDRQGNLSGEKAEYMHAELSGVVAVVMPAMARHGLSHRWNVRQEGQIISVDCIITHAQGHSEIVTMHGMPDDSGRKNLIQQTASTVTYLQRYTLMAACGVAAKGIDDDGRGGPEEITDADAEIVQKWLDAIKACTDMEQAKTVKQEFIDDYKGFSNVPAALKAAYLDQLHALHQSK
jgi:hypothetical protein